MTKKKEQENLQNVVFRMTPSELARVDILAEKIGKTRSQILRNLIMVGLEESEMFERFGMVRAAITVRDICAWMGTKITKGFSGEMDKEDEKK